MNEDVNMHKLNSKLKNKIFLFRSEDSQNDIMNEVDSNDKHSIQIVESTPILDIQYVQIGPTWMKLKFGNGTTYLFDSQMSFDMRKQKNDDIASIDTYEIERSIGNKIEKIQNGRFKGCGKCSFSYTQLNKCYEMSKYDTEQYFESTYDGLKNNDSAYLSEPIQHSIVEFMTKALDANGNAVRESNLLTLKIDGFPVAFYTEFSMTQLGNIQFYKALDPLIWYGLKLEQQNDDLDDPMAPL